VSDTEQPQTVIPAFADGEGDALSYAKERANARIRGTYGATLGNQLRANAQAAARRHGR